MKNILKEIKDKDFKILLTGVIVISFLTSGLFAYYTQASLGDDELENEVKSEQEAEDILTEKKIEYDISELLVEARDLYYSGDYNGSIEKYNEILGYENNKRARGDLAAIYEELGNYELARNEYKELLILDNQPKYRLDLAAVYYNLDELLIAEELLKSVVNDDESEGYVLRDSYYQLSLTESRRANYDKAEAYILRSLEYEEFAIGYRQLGDVYFALEDYQEAVNSYNRATRIDGSLVGVNKNRGIAYLHLEDYARASQRLKQAAAENRSDREVDEILDILEAEHPQYFVDERRVLPEEIQRPIPENVTFKDIEPLEVQGEEIRIGIKNEEEEIYFRVGSDFVVEYNEEIIDEGRKGDLLKATFVNGKYNLEIGEKIISFDEALVIRPKEYAPILLHNVVYGRGYYWGGLEDRQYRGALELLPRDNGITAINLVGLEEYLLAVVPSEMPASWGVDPLKVQSVAARSYTINNLGRFRARGYDLCDTVMSAAYGGINKEHPNATQAVVETVGEIATHKGRAIDAVYSANSGGHTENSEDVWSGKVPYLRGVSTGVGNIGESEFPLSPMELKDWLRQRPESYSGNPKYTPARNYRWQRFVSIEYLEDRLGIEGIKSVTPTARGYAGSITSLKVVGESEEREFRNNLRSRFGGLRSNRFWIQPQYQQGELIGYKFYGSGWGHSVGMDQVAVPSMIEAGHSYIDIIKHFYTDIEIEKR
ncbi:SpoIID/LytB domain-containing protein [Halonatronum saccharophilum]|uniref:SpoIID/LytB domain-containing protein n=1 Tax=Halonatronum saccharophilum TaxID=150060 RepID=UPI0004862713|nr:SpoIID/LytB domain-containing protein [Halonatronum saccharophilum]